MQKSLSFHLRKRMVEVFVWSVVLYGSETWTLQKRIFGGYWGAWWKYLGLSTKRTKKYCKRLIHKQKWWTLLEVDRSYPETWFITKDNVRKTITMGKCCGCGRPWTMFLLVTEDGGSQYQLRWTKDVGTKQIKMVSVKAETCHMGRILQHNYNLE